MRCVSHPHFATAAALAAKGFAEAEEEAAPWAAAEAAVFFDCSVAKISLIFSSGCPSAQNECTKREQQNNTARYEQRNAIKMVISSVTNTTY